MDPDELTDSHLRGFRQIAEWIVARLPCCVGGHRFGEAVYSEEWACGFAPEAFHVSRAGTSNQTVIAYGRDGQVGIAELQRSRWTRTCRRCGKEQST